MTATLCVTTITDLAAVEAGATTLLLLLLTDAVAKTTVLYFVEVWLMVAVSSLVSCVLPGADGDCVAVTGHTVVYSAMVSVVTWPNLAGQFVTSGAQDVMV